MCQLSRCESFKWGMVRNFQISKKSICKWNSWVTTVVVVVFVLPFRNVNVNLHCRPHICHKTSAEKMLESKQQSSINLRQFVKSLLHSLSRRSLNNDENFRMPWKILFDYTPISNFSELESYTMAIYNTTQNNTNTNIIIVALTL